MYSLLSGMQEYSWTSKEQSPVSFYTYLRKSSRDNLRESQPGHTPSGAIAPNDANRHFAVPQGTLWCESAPTYACNSFLYQRTEGSNSFFFWNHTRSKKYRRSPLETTDQEKWILSCFYMSAETGLQNSSRKRIIFLFTKALLHLVVFAKVAALCSAQAPYGVKALCSA